MSYTRTLGQHYGWLWAVATVCCAPLATPTHAATVVTLPQLDVSDTQDDTELADSPLNASSPNAASRRMSSLSSPDSASLFRDQPGFSSYAGGRLANLPVLNGMADDRVATFVDGVRISPACPNHMNPALSYIDPQSVQTATSVAGLTPVSSGGDSLGGSIIVERAPPRFARHGKILFTGSASGTYRSNGSGYAAHGDMTVANDMFSLRYNASYAEAGNYSAGGGFGPVPSTEYLTYSHDITFGMHKGNHLLALTFSQQDTPREGFPNQYMDMTNNRSTGVNGKYTGTFDWGELEATGYWRRVSHAMNMLADKGGHSATTGMPMNDESRTAGYAIKATIPLARAHTLRLGSSFDHEGLNDWWPPLAGSSMMGPDTFHTLNDAHRDRLGHFAEWEARWTPRLSTLLGLRNDVVMMNTGNVSPYSWMSSSMSGMSMMSGMGGMSGLSTDGAAAKAFNARPHGRTDVNFDVTAMLRWKTTDSLTIEAGYARKSRAPNLYERYAWGRSSMATTMIGWFGDGNGYVGNLDLKSEVANTASVTFDWHDPSLANRWQLKVQPYYTYAHNYINVQRIGSLANSMNHLNGYVLQFVNHNAQMYGINASGRYALWDSAHYGRGEVTGVLNWVRGQDMVSHSGLYQQMPLNGTLALNETVGPWTGRVELNLVKAKSTVDWVRNEARTPGYALLNLAGSYKWRMLTLNAGIDNIFNQRYYMPLGGLLVMTEKSTGQHIALPGMGRSFNVSLTATF
ncbi:TonB-dependent receptor [Acetobacter vaccinii]|uniref:TonB-dependent receptor n=1 Tax=Acetobacter vaccinii TaxID=2592655 RepID=A0A5C1YQH2_9PROT|nr:TonB-dependent receptor [Acetobacter vaccinii]QEO17469.1 TonB-dependent receptor [Acetobacter vaccinii]